MGLGLSFVVSTPPAFAEPLPELDENPVAYAMRSAVAKAHSLSVSEGAASAPSETLFPCARSSAEHSLIIAADTVVALGCRIFGKPQGHAEALHFLTALAGKTHQVTTGVALAHAGEVTSFAVTADVTFWDCPQAMVHSYANDIEVLDKAGAYAVQGKGAFLVRSIAGSWTTVVGLPVTELAEMLLLKGFVHPS